MASVFVLCLPNTKSCTLVNRHQRFEGICCLILQGISKTEAAGWYMYGQIQISVAYRRGYVLRNASLGDFVVVRTCTYTNLHSIAYYTPRLYGKAYCSEATNLHTMLLY
jgi:hypothetical protein